MALSRGSSRSNFRRPQELWPHQLVNNSFFVFATLSPCKSNPFVRQSICKSSPFFCKSSPFVRASPSFETKGFWARVGGRNPENNCFSSPNNNCLSPKTWQVYVPPCPASYFPVSSLLFPWRQDLINLKLLPKYFKTHQNPAICNFVSIPLLPGSSTVHSKKLTFASLEIIQPKLLSSFANLCSTLKILEKSKRKWSCSCQC